MSDLQSPPPAPGDHRSAKADAKAAKAREKAMRPWFKKKRFILPIILVVLGIAIASSSGGSEDDSSDVASDAGNESAEQADAVSSGGGEATEMDDVAVESCAVGEFNYIEMKLTVTNNSSKRSTYFIDTVVEGADGSQIDSGFATVDNLEPGQSTSTDAALMTEAPGGEFSCRIVEVDRMSDE